MDNKFFRILLQIFAFILILVLIYILWIFLFPEFVDTYGNPEINTIIRDFKEKTLHMTSPDGSLHFSF